MCSQDCNADISTPKAKKNDDDCSITGSWLGVK